MYRISYIYNDAVNYVYADTKEELEFQEKVLKRMKVEYVVEEVKNGRRKKNNKAVGK
jgi:hypothetical protein